MNNVRGYPAPAYRDGSRAGPQGAPGFQRAPLPPRATANARTPIQPLPKSSAERAFDFARAVAGFRKWWGPLGVGISLIQEGLEQAEQDAIAKPGNPVNLGWQLICGGPNGTVHGGRLACPKNTQLEKAAWEAAGDVLWHSTSQTWNIVYHGHLVQDANPLYWRGDINGWYWYPPSGGGDPNNAPDVDFPTDVAFIPHASYEEDPFGPNPSPDPEPSSAVDPLNKPIARPDADAPGLPYWSLPYRRPNVWRSPTEQSSRGNVAPRDQRRLVPGAHPWPPFVVRTPLTEFRGLPGPDIVGTPGRKPMTISPPSRHERRPPGKRTKEKKVFISAGKGVVVGFYNLNTEFKDVVEAFWEALPLKYRTLPKGYILPKGVVRKFKKKPMPTIPEMLKDLYRNWEHLDGQEVIENLVKNEIGDRVGAAIGKTSAKASRRAGFSKGIQLGPLF